MMFVGMGHEMQVDMAIRRLHGCKARDTFIHQPQRLLRRHGIVGDFGDEGHVLRGGQDIDTCAGRSLGRTDNPGDALVDCERR